MNALTPLLGTEFPLIQAPMAGVQGAALAVAVSNAGGAGLAALRHAHARGAGARTDRARRRHHAPVQRQLLLPHAARARRGARGRLARGAGALLRRGRAGHRRRARRRRAACRSAARSADLLEPFRPKVVSFHFGLPAPDLLARVKSWGSVVLSSATTVEEARWLEAHGVDAVIAQGVEAGGHRGMFLTDDLTTQIGTLRAAAADRGRRERAGDRGRRHCRRGGRGRGHGAGRVGRAGGHGLPVQHGGHHQRPAPRRAAERGRAPHRADPRCSPAGRRAASSTA